MIFRNCCLNFGLQPSYISVGEICPENSPRCPEMSEDDLRWPKRWERCVAKRGLSALESGICSDLLGSGTGILFWSGIAPPPDEIWDKYVRSDYREIGPASRSTHLVTGMIHWWNAAAPAPHNGEGGWKGKHRLNTSHILSFTIFHQINANWRNGLGPKDTTDKHWYELSSEEKQSRRQKKSWRPWPCLP